ncbi:DUF3566 domain-containing protein [Enemella sp. A6]|uniref:DUF3566 domain-containing protein n=1 Tax=Enemella sp. A6 TaxID=3440152 RepID=UPI003EB9A29C
MTDHSNSGGDDDTIVQPAVTGDKPVRQVAPPSQAPVMATPPAQVRPAAAPKTESGPVPSPARPSDTGAGPAKAPTAASGNTPGAPVKAPGTQPSPVPAPAEAKNAATPAPAKPGQPQPAQSQSAQAKPTKPAQPQSAQPKPNQPGKPAQTPPAASAGAKPPASSGTPAATPAQPTKSTAQPAATTAQPTKSTAQPGATKPTEPAKPAPTAKSAEPAKPAEPDAAKPDAAKENQPGKPAQPVRRGPRSKASARAAAAAGGAALGGAAVGAAAGGAAGSGAVGSKPDAPGATPAMGVNRGGAPQRSTAQVLGEDKKTDDLAARDAAGGDVATPDADAKTEVLASDASATRTKDGDDKTSGAKATAASVAASVKRAIGNPTTHRTRKARLRLAKFDPWSVMKTTFLFSIAFMIASLAAVMLLYSVISSSGVFDAINDIVGQVLAAPGDTTPFKIEDYLTPQRVAGFTLVVGVLNVVLMTAIGTLAAFLYNLASSLLGGLEVTLAED